METQPYTNQTIDIVTLNSGLIKHGIAIDCNYDRIDVESIVDRVAYIYITTKQWEQEPVSIDILAPRDWWQMFKKQYFPVWLLNRFPVKMCPIETIDAQYVYPHYRPALPYEQSRLRIFIKEGL